LVAAIASAFILVRALNPPLSTDCWAISVPGHTDDDIAYLINAAKPVLLTGDASHFAWAFTEGVAPHGWNKAGTTRGYVSLAQLRAFARAYPSVRILYGHEAE
jgi:glyoxylase-like metal-dependent hydrolase (beta-lactamase superfamily II)